MLLLLSWLAPRVLKRDLSPELLVVERTAEQAIRKAGGRAGTGTWETRHELKDFPLTSMLGTCQTILCNPVAFGWNEGVEDVFL